MSKKAITLLLVLTVFFSCAGCTNKPVEAPTGVLSEEGFVAENLTGKGTKADGTPIKVGLSVAELASEFIISAEEYITWMLEQAGAEVSTTNADNDVNKQMSHLYDFIEKGVDVIIVQPTDSEALAPAICKVNDAGIPVIAINRSVFGNNVVIDLFVGADDAHMGQVIAEQIAVQANGASVKVATIQGVLATANAVERAAGFEKGVSEHSNITITSNRPCEWDSELAMAATTDVMLAHPDMYAIFSHSDCMLPGIISGLTQANRLSKAGEEGHVLLFAIDGAPYALQQIREGYVDGTVEQSPLMMATVAVKGVLTKVAKGKTLGEKSVLIEPVYISKENVDDPSLWGNFNTASGELWPRTEEIWNKYLE